MAKKVAKKKSSTTRAAVKKGGSPVKKKNAPVKKRSLTAKRAASHAGATKTATAKTGRSTKTKTAKKTTRKWSARVSHTSDAMDLKPHIFQSRDPAAIARSIKRSSEKSNRRKGTPFQSAMSMLNFYLNRAGKNLTAAEKKPIEKAKEELRKLFHKE